MNWNKKQKMIIEDGVRTIKHSSKQVYEFGGYAGTGKSTIMMEITKQTGIPMDRIAAMSYIGQAALIMRSKGFINARTINSYCFSTERGTRRDSQGNIVINTYFNAPELGIIFVPKELNDIDLIVLDEGYTTPYKFRDVLLSKGKPILVAGDPGQLPPIGDKPAFLTNPNIPILDEVMRQDATSSILYLAERARKGLPISCGLYNNVLVIERKDLTDKMLINSALTICGKNDTKDQINNRVRKALGYKSRTPQYGERLICRKNNWTIDVGGISLANGLLGTVTNTYSPLEFDGNTFCIDFQPDLFCNHFTGLRCDYKYFTASTQQKKIIKNDRYSIGEKFDFGYCITTHLSQGCEKEYGIYIEEYLGSDIQNKLNYVGITRFKEFMIYVKPDRKLIF